jgi:hypothetical protein
MSDQPPPHEDQLTPMSKPFSPEATRHLAIVRGHKLAVPMQGYKSP